MSAAEFFADMDLITEYIFNVIESAWSSITSNWLLMLSFSIVILGFIVGLLNRIKHKKR